VDRVFAFFYSCHPTLCHLFFATPTLYHLFFATPSFATPDFTTTKDFVICIVFCVCFFVFMVKKTFLINVKKNN